MKKLYTVLLFFLLCFITSGIKAQSEFTPYDELISINKSYKPAYNAGYPDWGRMLYQYPINFNDITRRFDAYMLDHDGEKSAIIRYFKIWRRAIESYVLTDGVIKLPDQDVFRKNLMEAQINSIRKSKSAVASNANWTFLGPKETYYLQESVSSLKTPCPWQANVYSFDVAASNNSILYCGTETGYVSKTVDKGVTWQLLAGDYPFGGSVTAVAVHPSNPDIVYVSAGTQIHKTINGGTTWQPMLTTDLFAADRLKIDPNNPNKLIAASSKGVYVSADAGVTWTRAWSNQAWDIEFKPDDSNTILAISKDATGYFNVIVSTNGGTSFSVVANFPSYLNDSGALLAMTPTNPNLLYVAMLSKEGAETVPYIVKGILSGSSWIWTQTKKGEYYSATGLGGFTNGQGYFDLVLEASPTNANLLFWGTCSLWKSTDGGVNFSAVGGYKGSFPIHPDIQDLKLLPSGETWVSTDGGLTLTTDNFTNTSNASARNNLLVGSDFWGFDQGWNEDLVVGGRYHNGNTAIADFYQQKALRMGGGESATGWVLQGKSRSVAYNDLGNGWILPKTATGAPEGRFIFSKYPNMEEYGGRRSNLLHHPYYYGTLYLGEGTGFWRSTDLGVTFDLIYAFTNTVRYLQISYKNPNVIYADVVGQGLYRSNDGGVTWTLKPSLTGGSYGTSYWNGKLFFAISPYDENLIYACLQNGTWSADVGKVFRSKDGGDTWEDFTGSVTELTKCIVVQPTNDGKDLVYLFTNSKNGKRAKVYYRNSTMTDWSEYGSNFPSGMSINIALPFYRDSKLRVAGNGSVWESPLAETTFKPLVTPWVEKAKYNCMLDTAAFDDHSMLNHAGATWKWSFSPAPAFVDNLNIRNPKVVFGTPGKYTVTLTVQQNGVEYIRTINDMVTTTTCPSIDDCNNPAEVPKTSWKLIYADSENSASSGGVKAFDGDVNTIWHTGWSSGDVPYPHELQIDMGNAYQVQKFIYLGRQDGTNGRVKDFELYISNDKTNWGTATYTGSFTNTAAPQTIILASPKSGRYLRFKALSEVNGNAWASAAELSVVGCTGGSVGIEDDVPAQKISAFPIPTNGWITLALPESLVNKQYKYLLISSLGQTVGEGYIEKTEGAPRLDLSKQAPGLYFVQITDKQGTIFRIKVVKQ